MHSRNHKRRRAVLAWALLFAVTTSLGIFAAMALNERWTSLERIAELRFHSQKLSQRIATLKSIQQQPVSNHLQQQGLEDGFIQETNLGVAKADLQKMISRLVQLAGGVLISTHAIEGNVAEVFPELNVQLHMRGDIRVIKRLFFEIEQHKPSLFVKGVNIRNIVLYHHGTQEMDVRLNLLAYMREVPPGV